MLLTLLTSLVPLPVELAEALAGPDEEQMPVYVALYENPELSLSASVDPSKPEGERISVLSPKEEQWPKGFEEQLASFEAEADGDIWCDTAEEMIGGEVKETARRENAITYLFPIAIEDNDDKAERAFAKAAHGEIEIARQTDQRWRVAGLKIKLDKPFKPAMIAKVTKLNIEISCKAAPNGRMYQASTVTSVEGSALGRSFNEEESMQLRSVSFPSANGSK